MPKPTDIFTWATDANHPAGADAWSGQPNKVDPGSAKKAAGYQPQNSPPAEWQNYLLNIAGQWISWLDGVTEAQTDLIRYVPLHFATKGPGGYATGWAWNTPGGYPVSTDNSQSIGFDLTAYIPIGAQITAIETVVNHGAVRATGNAMEVELFEQSYPETLTTPTTTSLGSNEADGGASGVVSLDIDLSGSPYTVTGTDALTLLVTSGNDGGAHNQDALYWARVIYHLPEGLYAPR